MDRTSHPHCLFLEGQFAVDGIAAPTGRYDPTINARTLQLGADHAAPQAQMASLHETFHAFLNASTTYGTGMVLAGALADAGMADYADLVGRMVGECHTVHETYATLAALYAAATGRFDRELLAQYPLYHGYYAATAAVIDLVDRPMLASIVLDAAAHAAMQTDLSVRWRDLDCAAWLDTIPSPGPTPDERFEALQDAGLWARSRQALIAELHRQGGVAAELTDPVHAPEAVLERLRGLPAGQRAAMQEAAFAVFADALEALGYDRCGFDDQRALAPILVAKIEAFAGDRLKTRFHSPVDVDGDLEAVWGDHRRERLDLRPTPDRGVLVGLQGQSHEVLEAFTHRQEGAPYLQLVALPLRKALDLYGLDNREALLTHPADAIVTALRCRNQDAVLMLTTSRPEQVIAVQQGLPGVGVRPIVTSSVLADTSWRSLWMPVLGGPLPILIDTDPFQLLETLSAKVVRIGRMGLRSQIDGEPAHIDVLVLHGDAEPDHVYFTPCSSTMMKALLAYGQGRGWSLEETDVHVRTFQDLLLHAASHTVREERRFGFRFWE